MNNIEKYNYLRDNLALGIAKMAEICEQNKANDKNFDKYWDDLLSSAFTFFKQK